MISFKKYVVNAQSWQIFFAFIGAIVLYGTIPESKVVLKATASIMLALIIFGWFFLIGTSLNENLPEDEQKSDSLFTMCCLYSFMVVSFISIIKDVPFDEKIGAILIVGSFAISFFYIVFFTSTLFTCNQDRSLDRERLSVEVIFILFIVFVFGVLILQSRIKSFFK